MCAFCPPVDLLTKTTVLSKHNEQKMLMLAALTASVINVAPAHASAKNEKSIIS